MQWAEALGGIPREIGLWVTIVSNHDDSIVITDLDIDVQRESFQGTGTNVELCGPGGGGVPIHYIGVDLDVDPPSVTMYGTERPEKIRIHSQRVVTASRYARVMQRSCSSLLVRTPQISRILTWSTNGRLHW